MVTDEILVTHKSMCTILFAGVFLPHRLLIIDCDWLGRSTTSTWWRKNGFVLRRVGARKDIQPVKGKTELSQQETVKHCLSAIMSVWFFTVCDLLTLNVNDVE